MEPLGHPPGDNSDDPKVPTGRMQHQGGLGRGLELLLGLLAGRQRDASLDRVAVGIQSVEILCQGQGSAGVLGGQ